MAHASRRCSPTVVSPIKGATMSSRVCTKTGFRAKTKVRQKARPCYCEDQPIHAVGRSRELQDSGVQYRAQASLRATSGIDWVYADIVFALLGNAHPIHLERLRERAWIRSATKNAADCRMNYHIHRHVRDARPTQRTEGLIPLAVLRVHGPDHRTGLPLQPINHESSGRVEGQVLEARAYVSGLE